VNIGTLEIGEGHPCALIAELSNNANGEYDRAVRLLDAAKSAGASAAKLQCYSAAELVALRGDGPAPEPWGSQGWTMRALYEKAMTPREWFAPLYAHAAGIGLPLFSSVFGPESLELLESVGNPCYKLAALDFGQRELREIVEATGKPMIRSCANEFAPVASDRAMMLYCPPGYPQEHAHLRNIRHGYHGYSYHGTDPWIPAMAVAYGAHLVECHFQLEGEISELEEDVSLTDADFAYMVDEVRRMEALAA
jgi:sialic acid synthase SpsE